jgi:SAM-dependent methyltransferase
MDECALYTEPGLYDYLFPSAHDGASLLDQASRERALAAERFYVEEGQRGGGRVLELGCGPGRLTVSIARSGVEIVGLDLSTPMLDAARSKALAAGVNIQFVKADMRRFELPAPFSTILIPGNSLLHLLTTPELKDCFRCVRRHVAAGGRLVFDVSKWDIARLALDPDYRYNVMRLNDPERGEVTIEETTAYDAAEQVRDIKWYFSAPGAPDFRTIEYRLRVIFPQELPLLLEASGFRIEARFGEFTRDPFASSSPRQVCVCAPE